VARAAKVDGIVAVLARSSIGLRSFRAEIVAVLA
jgi:hypothetical protein